MQTEAQSNVIELDNYRKDKSTKPSIVRISSELDGLEALYSNDLSNEKLFTIKILFWALLDNGNVCAIIPWLKDIITTNELNNPSTGQWHGYYDQRLDRIMFKPPEFKVKELELGHHYFASEDLHKESRLYLKNPMDACPEIKDSKQELPDHLGTHAAFKHQDKKGFYLKPVISWKLTLDGSLQAMTIKQDSNNITPLPGSEDLEPASNDENFRYFFQHGIASRLKKHDPDTLTAVSLLIDLV